MSKDIYNIRGDEIPESLKEIPKPPKELYIQGSLPPEGTIYLTVVGARHHTRYGEDVLKTLITGLSGYPICIISGLALGIDTIAHTLALKNNLKTIAFPGSGLSDATLYPASNKRLRDEILARGGAIISEHVPEFRATMWSFPERNRLMAGMARATLIVEAEEKSGTLITARLALDYNRDLLVIPGPINSPLSVGTNKLLRLGAVPILDANDILEALGFERKEKDDREKIELEDLSGDERKILEILKNPTSRDDLIRILKKPAHEVTSTLSLLEIKELIKEEFGEIRRI